MLRDRVAHKDIVMKSFLSHVEQLKHSKSSFSGLFSYMAALGVLGATHANAAQFNPMFLKDKGAEIDLR